MLVQLGTHVAYCDLIGAQEAPVVCLNHSLAADSGIWAEQVPALIKAGFRVLRIDLRGHGGSTGSPGDYSLPALANDVVQILDFLAISRVHFIGLSIGGMIGQAFALEHSNRLSSLVLCDTLAASLNNAEEVWAPRVAAVTQTNSLHHIADQTLERWLSEGFKQKHPNRWKQIHETVCQTAPIGFLGCVSAICSFDFRGRLSEIEVPSLVICGSHDPSTTPGENKRIASLISNCGYEEVRNALHLPNVEQSREFNAVVTRWLSHAAGEGSANEA